jgi:hypothetical protein
LATVSWIGGGGAAGFSATGASASATGAGGSAGAASGSTTGAGLAAGISNRNSGIGNSTPARSVGATASTGSASTSAGSSTSGSSSGSRASAGFGLSVFTSRGGGRAGATAFGGSGFLAAVGFFDL